MIKNDRQYKITKSQRDKFNSSIETIESTKEDGLLKDLMIKQLISQIETFDQEIVEYEKLKNDRPAIIISNIEDLPEALIKARISKGFSQLDLAKKVGLKEQQIQRYESSNYESANLSKLIAIAKSMNGYFDQTKLILECDDLEVEGFEPAFIKEATARLRTQKRLLTI